MDAFSVTKMWKRRESFCSLNVSHEAKLGRDRRRRQADTHFYHDTVRRWAVFLFVSLWLTGVYMLVCVHVWELRTAPCTTCPGLFTCLRAFPHKLTSVEGNRIPRALSHPCCHKQLPCFVSPMLCSHRINAGWTGCHVGLCGEGVGVSVWAERKGESLRVLTRCYTLVESDTDPPEIFFH